MGRTDWKALKKLDEKTIEARARSDRDADDLDWARAEVHVPHKEKVSIRIDADVLQHFRTGGRGYQSRINRVLRRYVEAQRTG
jgi:uncharacterized protein (DUF4415 family)